MIVPIKFRCNYCRQFLGISRAQAGGVVDCPTCGRSIRVPISEGAVQLIADPELERNDTQLSRALDELAKLIDAPVHRVPTSPLVTRSDLDAEGEADEENLRPQPILEPIPIEVPLLPTPVIVRPAANLSLENSIDDPLLHQNEQGLLAELAALSEGISSNPPEEPPISSRAAPAVGGIQKRSSLMLFLIASSLFVAGMLMERFAQILPARTQIRDPEPMEKKATVSGNELQGRITYKTKAGASHPDRGARVLVFPAKRTGDARLSVVGFRPGDSLADQQIANATLKEVGGAAATADEQGEYQLSLEAGTYQILVLSHFQSGDGTTEAPNLKKWLADYFEVPEQLLGRVQHAFSRLRINGTGEVWDYAFE